MTVRVAAFARIREIVGARGLERTFPRDATANDVWRALAREFPALAPLERSTRFARNGVALADGATALADGDELALLPPFGGG